MSYTAKDIQILEGLEGIRRRPTMYIGSIDSFGVFQIWKEVWDNATDEALAGHAKNVSTLIDGNTFTVWDDGRGIPVEKHAKRKHMSTLEVVFSTLHAGGKLDDKGGTYSAAVGTHGIGSAATNALSAKFEAWTFRNNKWYYVCFERGKLTVPLKANVKPSIGYGLKPYKQGTVVRFTPDNKIFPSYKVQIDRIKEKVELAPYFTKGLACNLHVVRKGKLVSTAFARTKGVQDLLTSYLEEAGAEPLGKQTFLLSDKNLDIALLWSNADADVFSGYVCGSYTAEGGTHMQGFYKALTDAIAPYKKKLNFRIDDLKIGLIGILNLNIPAPVFSSQTKEKLATANANSLVYDAVYKPLCQFFAKNKSLTQAIVKRAAAIRSAVQDSANARKAAASLKLTSKGKTLLPHKLLSSPSATPKNRELFIVEGDSAAGSGKSARNAKYQEVLPLRGKVLNVYKSTDAKSFENNEILDILKAVGYDPSLKDPLSKLRVNRIVLLTDADEDGPLSGDTKVLTVNGKEQTLEELWNTWPEEGVWVWARDEGNVIPAKAINIARVESNTGIRIHLSDGSVFDTTSNHKWVTVVRKSSGEYTYAKIPAKELQVGDNLSSVPDIKQKVEVFLSIVGIELIVDPNTYFCLEVPETENFYVEGNNGIGVLTGNSHIEILVLSVLYRYLPELFDQKKVFTVDAPLYKGDYKGKQVYADTLKELQQKYKGISVNTISRLKGWGEANADLLRDVAFSEKTRKLFRVTPIQGKDKATFLSLVSNDTGARKKLLGI